MKRTKLPKVGDVMEVMRTDAGAVYAYYIHLLERSGGLTIFYECPPNWKIEDGFADCKYLFGPILCGLYPPVRDGSWKIVGKIPPPPDYNPPLFLSGGAGSWWLIDGEQSRHLGERIHERFKDLEILMGWPAVHIEERIRGEYEHNYYTEMRGQGFEP